jgi:amino acid adenylation domain-containing protein
VSDLHIEDTYPLTPTQEELLSQTLAAGRSRAAVEQHAVLYRGRLEIGILRRAWQRMMDRHAVLRTVFAWDPERRPRQQVLREATLAWSEPDWRGKTAAEREEALGAFLLADRDRRFDITREPPLRVTLIRMADDEHHLVWTFHPILFDARSIGILAREVDTCYEAFLRRAEPELPSVRPFRDYVEWLGQQDPSGGEAFWQRYLKGFAAPTRLDDMDGAATEVGLQEEHIELPEATGARLRSFAREHQLELGMVFRAVWALLLSRHAGECDVVFGATLSPRPPAMIGLESMVGLLAWPLPIRIQVAEEETFLAAAKRLQGIESGLVSHQHSPLAQSRIWSGAARGARLFESVVIAGDDPPERGPWCDLSGAAVTAARSWPHTSHPLHLRISSSDRFHLSLWYDGQRFGSASMRSLLQQVPTVLDQALARPEAPLSRLSLVTPESRSVLPDLAEPLVGEELAPVTTIFDSWVTRSPGAPALRQRGETLTYAELSERARAVAQALRAGGCQAREVVALDGWPSFGLIASLLGTLLAGGVVLMLDRRLPADRRRLMCREAGAKHLVRLSGAGASGEWWAELSWVSVVSVDLASGTLRQVAHAPEAPKPPEPGGEDDAYVFFTSGTTGVPKGVLGTHRGLSHFVGWQRATFGVGPGDRSSHLTGLSFDIVLREIFLPLTSGATLCLPDEPEELGAERVLPWLEREGITTLHTVPSLADTWLLTPPEGVSLGSLRRVFFAGEPLSSRLVQRWRAAFGTSAKIVNLYGPTETTLAKCFYLVPDEPGEGVQPVGRPLPRSQALVLADGGRPCGVGEWGEIVIRTPYRTRGYVNVPEENARRFRPNPLRPDHGDLLYHTGDRGRFRPDGILEISGRLDDQVKVHGARVEPAEIAAVLDRHPSVRSSVVLGQKGTNGRTRLVAYVVPQSNPPPTPLGLKAFLSARLPDYMVPSAFVPLERLPLTPNGKVDRRALEGMDGMVTASRAAITPPRGETEKAIAAIWAEVLGIDDVGADESFFELGGNSLLMLAVITRARARGFDLEHLTMFRHPTVQSLARHLTGERPAVPDHQAVRRRGQRQREALSRQRKMAGRS